MIKARQVACHMRRRCLANQNLSGRIFVTQKGFQPCQLRFIDPTAKLLLKFKIEPSPNLCQSLCSPAGLTSVVTTQTRIHHLITEVQLLPASHESCAELSSGCLERQASPGLARRRRHAPPLERGIRSQRESRCCPSAPSHPAGKSRGLLRYLAAAPSLATRYHGRLLRRLERRSGRTSGHGRPLSWAAAPWQEKPGLALFSGVLRRPGFPGRPESGVLPSQGCGV